LYSPLAHPFVCGCHNIATIPLQLDDTRPPWVTHLSSPPCRPHTPWCDGEEPTRLRLHSAGSTIPRLGPTGSSSGWLPLITTRWCSASPSDPPSREAPCPPKVHARWLQVPLGRVPLSRACPFRVLHTCLALRPVRHYPHFWISTWGLRLSGTSTHLTYVLPGTHYTPVRLPVFVHRWLLSLDFPPRPATPSLTGKHGISRFSREVFLCMPGFFDRARSPNLLPWRGLRCCLPLAGTASAPRMIRISRLNSPPAHAPVNASRPSLRATAHDSGSV
jgi:hypothetical protein